MFGEACSAYEVTIYILAGFIGGAIFLGYLVAHWPQKFGLTRAGDGTQT